MPDPIEDDQPGVPKVGDLIGGKLRIVERLGQGGMGVVLAGEHLDLRQEVAIKVLRPALAREPDALARFVREARAAASITSRHAVRIHDIGTTEHGLPYMVMERLHGMGVDALLAERGPLAVDEAVRVVVEAAEAVAEANRLGIVHRDLKPSNLFVAEDASGDRLVKVLDFGISKRVTEEIGTESATITAPQTLLGSPHYMSPEQLRDPRSVDARTDVWGLGVTLYEVLTGRLPFEAESMPELCAQIFHGTPSSPSLLRSDVPPGLSDVILRCLAKSADDRISSIPALVAELVPFCPTDLVPAAEKLARTARSGVPRSSTPPSSAATPRSVKNVTALGAAGVSVALVVGFVVWTPRQSPSAAPSPPMVRPMVGPASPALAASVEIGAEASDGGPAVVAPRSSEEATAPLRPVAAASSASSAPKVAPLKRGLKGITLIE